MYFASERIVSFAALNGGQAFHVGSLVVPVILFYRPSGGT
jgi:hypothetical protein